MLWCVVYFGLPLSRVLACVSLTLKLLLHQGVYARHLQGNASNPAAGLFAEMVEPLVLAALKVIQRLVKIMNAFATFDWQEVRLMV